MIEMLVIAGLICIVDRTGFLCDERLKDLLYIKDEHEKPKESPAEITSKDDTTIETVKEEVKEKPKNKSKKKESKTVDLKETPLELNSDPLADLDSFGSLEDFGGFNFREPGGKPKTKDENGINKDAIFGDFQDEDEIPLMDDLDDIAAAILSDIYGGVY